MWGSQVDDSRMYDARSESKGAEWETRKEVSQNVLNIL